MKTLSFLCTLLILTCTLQARENPFEPSLTYEEEVARMMEVESDYTGEFAEGNVEYEKMTPAKPKPKPVAKTQQQIEAEAYAKKVAQENIKKAKMLAKKKREMEMKKAQEMAIKMKMEKEAMEKAKNDPMIYVKYREDVEVNQQMDILPFIDIEYTNTSLKILSKYKVFKKFYIEKENKLILDFKGVTKFFTRHHDLESKYFKKISVGNHKKEKFFRIVLVLTEHPNKYSVTYDTDEVLITLNEEMIQ
jgi:hypothetical protein